MKRHSNDLRIRAVKFVKEGNSKSSAIKIFKIARQTIYDWIKLDSKGKLTEIREYPFRGSKVDYDELMKYVELNPDLYYHEIGQHFNTSDENVRKILKKLNYSVKKNKRYIRKGTKN